MVDSFDTRVLWSERAVGIQGYGRKEENLKGGSGATPGVLPITKQHSYLNDDGISDES